MKRSLELCAIVLGALVLLPLGCHGPGDSPESTVETALSAARDGDKAALEACFMPGLVSAYPAYARTFADLLKKNSLRATKWSLSGNRRSDGSTVATVAVQFGSPLAVSGRTYRGMMIGLVRDSAVGRRIWYGEVPPPGLPGPTGRWVTTSASLRR